MYTLAHTLNAVDRFLPPPLVGPGARADVHHLARQLPAALSNWVYLECRLREHAEQVDVVIKIDEAGRAILAGEHPTIAIPAAVRARAEWGRLGELCTQWADPRASLAGVIDHLWLEFDVASGSGAEAPVPGVFVSFGEVRPPRFTAERWLAHALRVLPVLRGHALPPAQVAALERCHECLPLHAYVPYAGLMLSRGEGVIRLCITRLRDDDIPSFLKAVGWPGRRDDITSLLAVLREARGGPGEIGATMLHLDIVEGLTPRIGLEYAFDRRAQLFPRGERQPLLEHLCRAGLCTEPKKLGLLAWPGASCATLAHEIWRSRLVRLLNHVKIVHDTSGSVEAKAYLCLSHDCLGSGRPAAARAASIN